MTYGPQRVAMWSGPRNISTALMRAWENRNDTVVVDEPFYAHYLVQSGAAHPGAEEVIAHHETDWRKVVTALTGPLPAGATVFYQKHMAHHLYDHMDGDWVWELDHCFLIRDPREMLLSLSKVLPRPQLEETGLPQQVRLFDRVRERTGVAPPVLDAKDVLMNPAGLLSRLCERLGVEFERGMLEWPAGRRDSDGIWAPHWYAQVERSTGFQPYVERHGTIDPALDGVLDACEQLYAQLHAVRLVP